MADLPGLIEGASFNKGLGHAFLKHTEKAKALALVVSIKRDSRECSSDHDVTVTLYKIYLVVCFKQHKEKKVAAFLSLIALRKLNVPCTTPVYG